jgi:DMSO/TMAO reductase YedYZ heme-binding membrane subunit
MSLQLRVRFWTEAALAALSGVLFVMTIFWKDWIEAVFGVDPDRHSGSLEWAIVAVLLVVTLLFGLLARAEWRGAAPRAEGAGG